MELRYVTDDLVVESTVSEPGTDVAASQPCPSPQAADQSCTVVAESATGYVVDRDVNTDSPTFVAHEVVAVDGDHSVRAAEPVDRGTAFVVPSADLLAIATDPALAVVHPH